MIHHISIVAQNPLRVAHVLAEIWHGQVFAFFPNPGGYLVTMSDDYGSAIEVYPLQDQLVPGTGDAPCQIIHESNVDHFVGIHAAVSVPSSEAHIKQISDREGWRAVTCDRGGFNLIELWVENRFLLELLPPEFTAEYLAFTQQPQLVEQVFGAPIVRESEFYATH